jgi:hypothetical protein
MKSRYRRGNPHQRPKSVLARCAAEGTVEPLPKVLSFVRDWRASNINKLRDRRRSKQPTSACGAPLWMKMVAARAGLSEPRGRAIVLRLTSLRWLATPKNSGPRCVEVPFFVALGNGEHAWQCLERTCREGPQLRAARRAVARPALSRKRPRRRRARRSQPGARRLHADARSPRHRRCWQRLHNNLMREGFRARPITILVNGRRAAAEW